MKVLTVKQPWAYLIIHGGKDIENRKWSTKFRGRILIHSSKADDKEYLDDFCQKDFGFSDKDLIRGAIIGSVEITDCVKESTSYWFIGPIGWVLKNPKPEKIEFIKGQLGLWTVNKNGTKINISRKKKGTIHELYYI